MPSTRPWLITLRGGRSPSRSSAASGWPGEAGPGFSSGGASSPETARGRRCDSPGPGSKAARARKSRPCGGRRSGSSAGRQGPVLGPVGSAVQVAEKLRKLVEEEEFGIEGGLTVSVGVAAHEQGDTVESLAVRADEALYRTKQSGKNCVYL
jgi:hypothetical protein